MTSTFNSKYKVLKKIGEGSFSEVVKCEDRTTRELYAAKRLKKVFKSESHVLNCAEVIATRKLSYHPNIVHMIEYHYDPVQSKAIFVFELMDMSIYDFIRNKKKCIQETRAKNYLYQILKGLDHLHKNGLFHRDVKPENVLIKVQREFTTSHYRNTYGELVKLADLGSIRGVYSSPPYTEYISTRWYRSPECLLTNGYYGPKMDVWATGCVFYEILTLKPLFPGSNEIDQLSRIHAIIGSPSPRLLNKFKAKSRNCAHFPKQVGSGLHSVLSSISEYGEKVLKLMLLYDPDQRINVRRLLEHRYFEDFRHEDLVNKYKTRLSLRATPRNKGDYGTAPELQNLFELPSQIHNKYKCENIQRNSNESKTKPNLKTSFGVSRTTIEVPGYCKTVKSRTNLIGKQLLPLADHKVMKTWGVNPNILKAKEQCKDNVLENDQNRAKQKTIKKKKVSREKSSFRKTTSNLPQIMKGKDSTEKCKKQMHSKSFVLPWRKPGQTNIEIVNDAVPKIIRAKRQKV